MATVSWGSACSTGLSTELLLDTPVHVKVIRDATAIAAENWTSLALLANGTVMGWGWNEAGQIGQPPGQGDFTPAAVSGLTDVKAISAGAFWTLALLYNGTVMAIGADSDGELGDGTILTNTSKCSYQPVQVSNLSGVTSIVSGTLHALALLDNGTVMAWGNNTYGQLGDGTMTSDVPVQVSGLPGAATETRLR